MSELFEQFEVLHVSCADLNNIDFIEEIKLREIHDFSNDRQTGILFRFQKQIDTLFTQALECVGRSAGFERSAAQNLRS